MLPTGDGEILRWLIGKPVDVRREKSSEQKSLWVFQAPFLITDHGRALFSYPGSRCFNQPKQP